MIQLHLPPILGKSCCSDLGWCGKLAKHCSCPDCEDFRALWRKDLRCGPMFKLPNGMPAQCDPRSAKVSQENTRKVFRMFPIRVTFFTDRINHKPFLTSKFSEILVLLKERLVWCISAALQMSRLC